MSSSYKLSLIKTKIYIDLKNTKIQDHLYKYEHTITPLGSFIIKIIDYIKEPQASINDINGSICYKIYYSAMIFHPIIGSVIDVKITKIKYNVGIWSKPTILMDLYNPEEINAQSTLKPDYNTKPDIYCITANEDINIKDINKYKDRVLKLKITNRQIEYNKMIIYGILHV